jgi:uncharacterized protein YjbJ (UPF0337 family)
MDGEADVVKGRIKEAAGVLTGNDRPRAQGKVEQAGGKLRELAEKAVDKVKQTRKKLQE